MTDIKLDTYYFVDLLYNKNHKKVSDEDAKERQIKHLKHLNDLTIEGIVLVAGPIGGGDGILICDHDKLSEEELIAKLNQDPHVQAGSHSIKVRTLYVPKHSIIFTQKQYNMMMDNDLKRL